MTISCKKNSNKSTKNISKKKNKISKDMLHAGLESLYRRSLFSFMKAAWNQIEYNTLTLHPHIKVICDHLEAVKKGKINRLIINIAPGLLKSTTVSVVFPAWCWTSEPYLKFLTGSHTKELAMRDTVKSRQIIESKWYKQYWGNQVKFLADQNQKSFYQNQNKGYRTAFSTGSSITGHRGDIIILDDPMNYTIVNSKTIREFTNHWISGALMSRLNQGGKVIIIMQRLHQDDCTQYLLNKGGWEHLYLPMEFNEKQRCKTSLFIDKRKNGELLIKGLDIKKLKENMSSYDYASQYQQLPAPQGGGLIKENWLRFYEKIPDEIELSAWAWDTAVKIGEQNDYSVGTLWIKSKNGFYLKLMYRDKVIYPDLKDTVEFLYKEHPTGAVYIEDKASGQQLIQDLGNSSIPVIPVMPKKDIPGSKYDRVNQMSTMFKAGKIFLPKNDKQTKDIIEELTLFPNAAHDDIVDSISTFLCMIISQQSDAPKITVFNI